MTTLQALTNTIGKEADNGKVVSDVICTCKHSVTHHKSLRAAGMEITSSDTGIGQCTKCGCDVFRFKRNRYEKKRK